MTASRLLRALWKAPLRPAVERPPERQRAMRSHSHNGSRRTPGKRDFLDLSSLSAAELQGLLGLGLRLKSELKSGLEHPYLRGRTLAMIFQKPSLRTRLTFETGMAQLGGHAIYLAPGDIGIGERESVKDVARNLSRWVDLIMVRTFAHSTCVELAREASVPVINGLTDALHPCQLVADLMTSACRDPHHAANRRAGAPSRGPRPLAPGAQRRRRKPILGFGRPGKLGGFDRRHPARGCDLLIGESHQILVETHARRDEEGDSRISDGDREQIGRKDDRANPSGEHGDRPENPAHHEEHRAGPRVVTRPYGEKYHNSHRDFEKPPTHQVTAVKQGVPTAML